MLFASMFIFRSCVCRKSLSVLIRRTGSCCVLSTRPQPGPSKHRRLPKITPRNNPLKWLLTAAGCGGGFHPAAAQTASHSFGLSGDRLSLRPQVGAGVCELVLSGLIIIWRAARRHLDICFELSQPERTPPTPHPQGSGQKVSLSGVSTKALGYHQ